MRTLNGRAKNASSLINSASTGSCGGPAKGGVVQAVAYPRIAKGVLLSRAPNQRQLVCSMGNMVRQYRYQAGKKILG